MLDGKVEDGFDLLAICLLLGSGFWLNKVSEVGNTSLATCLFGAFEYMPPK